MRPLYCLVWSHAQLPNPSGAASPCCSLTFPSQFKRSYKYLCTYYSSNCSTEDCPSEVLNCSERFSSSKRSWEEARPDWLFCKINFVKPLFLKVVLKYKQISLLTWTCCFQQHKRNNHWKMVESTYSIWGAAYRIFQVEKWQRSQWFLALTIGKPFIS